MRAPILPEFDLTAEELDVEQDTNNKRKSNPIVAEKSKNFKNKKKSDSKRANLVKTMDNVMASMQESAQTRMMMTIMQIQQDNQVKPQAQPQAQMQTQMQAQMQMMQTMIMALTGRFPAGISTTTPQSSTSSASSSESIPSTQNAFAFNIGNATSFNFDEIQS
jgi:exosome complex RNA-binding protein Csl4